MSIVKTRGFIKTGTSLWNKINWYYVKNTDNLFNYRTFLESIKKELIDSNPYQQNNQLYIILN